MNDVMWTCIILHDMHAHDRRDDHKRVFIPDESLLDNSIQYNRDLYASQAARLHNDYTNSILTRDLVAQLWMLKG